MGGPRVTGLTMAALALTAFLAGGVDAIAGGGGLLTVPALLAAGLDPRVALGTNKGQSVFGALSSTATYARHGVIDRRRAIRSALAAALGGAVGVRLALALDPRVLRPVAIGLLLVAALVLVVRNPGGASAKRVEPAVEPSRLAQHGATALTVLLGVYDGFFGPGTGAFLILTFTLTLGHDLVRASGNAKIANTASNVVAMLAYASAGVILWQVALPMALAQVLGARLGARMALHRGAGFVRKIVVLVCLALTARLLWQLWA